MLHVQCPGCMTQAFLECTCPPGWLAAAGQHQPGCTHANPDANLACPPGSSCCQQDHDHAAAANACPGGHGDCPEPGTCPTWATAVADTLHPHYRGEPPGPCPGGHCHKDLEDCTVCRPLVITVMPGTAIQPVAG